MSFRPDTVERKLIRLEKKLREARDELFLKSRGVNATLTAGISVGGGPRGATGSFQGMRSFIPQDITIDDLDENRVSTGNFEHITLGGGAFLRVKANTGIAGQLKFIHGQLQDGQFLILSPDSVEPGATLRLLTGGNISIASDVVLQRNEIAILIFDETLPLNEPDGNYMVIAGGSGGGGVACPVICPENDLGDVQGVTAIDWSLSPFHRMRMIGATQIVMINTPTAPGWHEITVQFLEDPTGGFAVTFLDVFRNTPIPVVRKGANRYTIVKFYSYFNGFEHIFTWQPPYLTNSEVAQPSINQGMIHAILSATQTSNLAVNDHIEFDTILFQNNMAVSIGAGQLSGIFSGFKKARTYELTATLGVNKGAPPGGFFTYQWFDIALGVFIGSKGTASDPDGSDPYQQIAKAFFQAGDVTDTVELKILSQSGFPIDTVFNFAPESFAEIKDCGQTQEQFDEGLEELLDEDTELLPSTPPFAFTVNSTLFNNYFRRNPYSNVAGTIVGARVVIPFETNGARIFATTISLTDLQVPTGQAQAGTFGFIKKVRMKIKENTLNKAIQVKFFRNGGDIGTLFTINAGATGNASSTGSTPIAVGDRWSFLFETTDGLIPSGFMSWSMSTDIEWGLV